VWIDADGWGRAVRVYGPGMPSVELARRFPRPTTNPAVTVDGQPVTTSVRWLRFTRGACRVRLSAYGRSFLLRPTKTHEAVILRDERVIAQAHGRPKPDPEARLYWQQSVDRLDVVVAYTLTAGFAAGAHGLLFNVFDAAADFS
jgi:hypothetical protein